jgi:hypothetical protein
MVSDHATVHEYVLTAMFRYSSSAEINPYSALIHNFFAQETGPSTPAIHLTVDTEALANGNADGALAVKAYVA